MDLSRFLNRFSRRFQNSGIIAVGLLTAVILFPTACGSNGKGVANQAAGTIPIVVDSPLTEKITVTPIPNSLQSTRIQEKRPTRIISTATVTVSSKEAFTTATRTIIPSPTQVARPSASFPVINTAKPPETSAPIPKETRVPFFVNGLSSEDFIITPENVRRNVREIFTIGRTLGRNPNAFSKLGDSVTLTDHYLTRFDSGNYILGPYEALQPTKDHYNGSFGRFGVATKVGLHAWSIFDPLWASDEWCAPEENMVACEIRLYNPSVFLIKIGSNDNGDAEAFNQNMRQLVEYLISSGVVPVLGTKADRFEGPDDRNNKIIRQIASDFEIPLWDYDRVAGTLPRRGLSGDDIHLTMADSNDYSNMETFDRGYPVSDLTALMMLDVVLEELKISNES